MLLPVKELISVCRRHGAMVLVDGAHAPGQIDLDLENLGADFFAGQHALHVTCISNIFYDENNAIHIPNYHTLVEPHIKEIAPNFVVKLTTLKNQTFDCHSAKTE